MCAFGLHPKCGLSARVPFPCGRPSDMAEDAEEQLCIALGPVLGAPR